MMLRYMYRSMCVDGRVLAFVWSETHLSTFDGRLFMLRLSLQGKRR